MELVLECHSEVELEDVAERIISFDRNLKIIALSGELGAGKTTLTKYICRKLGVKENISSPTFGLIHQYEGKDGKAVYHCDFYRLKGEAEAVEIGAPDIFYSGNYCIVEWPEKVSELFPQNYLSVKIIVEDEKREFIIIAHGN